MLPGGGVGGDERCDVHGHPLLPPHLMAQLRPGVVISQAGDQVREPLDGVHDTGHLHAIFSHICGQWTGVLLLHVRAV
jgi:hypothetical protein